MSRSGPCLCGDPYCPSCGNPELAKQEEAYEKAVETFYQMGLTVDECQLAIAVSAAVIKEHRKILDWYLKQRQAEEQERRAYIEPADPS